MTTEIRCKLRIEFEGEAFCGWQKQSKLAESKVEHGVSLQTTVEAALQTALRSVDRRVVVGCGRTDAGVHADEYYCHFDLLPGEVKDLELLRHSLNGLFPEQLSAVSLSEAPHFHALRDVKKKVYRYRCLLRRSPSALERKYCYQIPLLASDFDWKAFEHCRAAFLGDHNFQCFSSERRATESAWRRIDEIRVRRSAYRELNENGEWLEIDFEAKGFLKQMVRLLSGALIEVGQGRRSAEDIVAMLREPEREFPQKPFCAPARGLFLHRVHYES